LYLAFHRTYWDLSSCTVSIKKHGSEKTYDTLFKNNPTRRTVMVMDINEHSLLRLPHVLALIPISRSAWWAGCKSGRFPKPVKIGPRTSAWRGADIIAVREKILRGEAI
jgi:predicted DNA-binding transcriptional regulator AlpA